MNAVNVKSRQVPKRFISQNKRAVKEVVKCYK